MDQPSFSVVRLNPKGDARAIRHGFPWVYANEVVTDRRTKAMTAGTIAILEDAERRPMGLVAVNTASKIFCRMLERDVDVVIDAECTPQPFFPTFRAIDSVLLDCRRWWLFAVSPENTLRIRKDHVVVD